MTSVAATSSVPEAGAAAPPGEPGGVSPRNFSFGGVASFLLQLGLAFFVVNRFMSGRAAAPAAAPAPPLSALSASPSLSPPPPSPPSMLDMLSGRLPSRRVHPALAVYEEHRLAALAAAPDRAVLANVWPPSVRFALIVALSSSAAPITDFAGAAPPAEEAALAGGGGGDGADGSGGGFGGAGVGGAASLPAWRRALATARAALSSESNVLSLFASPPDVRYANATYGGLADVRIGSATTAAPADASTLGRLPDPAPMHAHSARPLWVQRGLRYDASPGSYRLQQFNITLPPELRANTSATVFAHVYFVLDDGGAALPLPDAARPDASFHIAYALVRHLDHKPKKARYNLLGEGADKGKKSKGTGGRKPAFGIGRAPARGSGGGETDGGDDGDEEAAAASASSAAAAPVATGGNTSAVLASASAATATSHAYWVPTLHVQLVDDRSTYSPRSVPPHAAPSLMALPRLGGYYPVGSVNDFWLMSSDLIPLEPPPPASAAAAAAAAAPGSDDSPLPLTVSYSTQAAWQWALQAQVQLSWQMQEAMGTSRERETDMMKGVLLATNPVLLAVTVVVSTLHMVFEMLAFKNDISFWRSAKSMEGLSLRSIAVNVFFQAVITLYLFDNDTSWMILFSSVVGLAIEAWKLRKAFAVAITWPAAGGGWLPRLAWGDRADDERYAASRTEEYDAIATSHMLAALLPLVAGYAAYSLFYDVHRSWWSWLLSSLVGFVYIFGFIQLVPQLYINYRLKSVAALPWKAMVYKSLTTFIDDLFAFVIKMPTLHRIAVFRDDVIFFIFLYQRWIYRVDPVRKNEFGASAADYAAAEARRQGKRRVSARSKYDKAA